MSSQVFAHRSVVVLIIVAISLSAIAAVGLHWTVTLAAWTATVALAAVQLPVVVSLVVLSIPVQSELSFPFVAGELTLTQLWLLGLIVGWLVLFWRRRVWLDSIVVGFLLVLAAYAVSLIAVDNPGLWFQETYRWAVAGVFYVICRSVISGWQHIRLILWSMAIGVVGVTALSLIQMVGALTPGDYLAGGVTRVYGTFGTPNTLAAYLEMTIPMLIVCVPIAWRGSMTEKFSSLEKWLFAMIPLAGLLVVGLTQSRGGWVGMAAALVVIWVQLPNRTRVISGTAAVILIGGFLMTAPGQSQLERFARVGEETSRNVEVDGSRSSYDVGAGRGALWATAREMIADRPFTGVGAGEFDENYREYVPSWIDRIPRGQAHNVWLQMGAQAGIWGIMAYAWWFGASVWSVFTARRNTGDRSHFWLITGVLAVFAAYTFHSLVDYLNVLSLGLQLSVLTAIALNLAPEPLARYSEKTTPAAAYVSSEVAPCPK